VELPVGVRSLEDFVIIEHLFKDEVFKSSIEETEGKLKSIYADWENNLLIFEFIDGTEIQSDLYNVIKELKKINYMREWAN